MICEIGVQAGLGLVELVRGRSSASAPSRAHPGLGQSCPRTSRCGARDVVARAGTVEQNVPQAARKTISRMLMGVRSG